MGSRKHAIFVSPFLLLGLCIAPLAIAAGAGDASGKAAGSVIVGKDGSLAVAGKSVTVKTGNTFGAY
jgi:hypothetical protein